GGRSGRPRSARRRRQRQRLPFSPRPSSNGSSNGGFESGPRPEPGDPAKPVPTATVKGEEEEAAAAAAAAKKKAVAGGRGLLAARCAEAAEAVSRVEDVFRRAKAAALEALLHSSCPPGLLAATTSTTTTVVSHATVRESEQKPLAKAKASGSSRGVKESAKSTVSHAAYTSHRAQQAIVDFLLSDPDDEALLEGILLPVLFPSSSFSAAPGEGHRDACSSYWHTLLLDAAIRKCTPATAERCLHLALRAAGNDEPVSDDGDGRGGGGGGGGGGGSLLRWGSCDADDERGDLLVASTAAVVLRGLCRLARDPRVAIRAPQVGEVGGADSLEA
ncbi:unnamed protein product, partial [Ectocarpus sp. 12 AP-2014]